MSFLDLPLEILLLIFQLTAPSPIPFPLEDYIPGLERPFLYPVTLGAVSSIWRQAVWSSPSLWTTFSFHWSMWSFENTPTLLLLYLQNSQNLPLELALSCKWESRGHDLILFSSSIDPVLIENLSRVKILALEYPSRAWLGHLDKLSSAVQLSMKWDLPPVDSTSTLEIILSKYPSLHRVNIVGPTYGWFTSCKLPESLTVLHLVYIPIDTCFRLILQLPSLLEISVLNPFAPESPDADLGDLQYVHSVAFEYLEVFIWDFGEENVWTNHFFKCAYMPVLRILRMVNPGTSKTNGIEENLFLERLPSTLSILELQNVGDVEFLASLHSDIAVEHLVLLYCRVEVILNLIDRLTPQEEKTLKTQCLPRLKSLSIYGRVVYAAHKRTLEPSHINALILMLQNRLTTNDVFRIEFKDFRVDWTDMTKAVLQEMVAQSVRIETLENSEPVGWLKRI